MTKRKLVTVSLTDEIVKVLKEICEDTGLDKSKVIQELILKAGVDKKTREIITANNYARVARKKMSGSSHNVHCVNTNENASTEPYPEEASYPGQGTFILSEINGQKAINGLIIPSLFGYTETFQNMTIEKQYEILKYYYEHK